MHPLIARHRSGDRGIGQRDNRRRCDVFGSAARADDFNPASSDADFLVEFAPGASAGLDELFGAKEALTSFRIRHSHCWRARRRCCKSWGRPAQCL